SYVDFRAAVVAVAEADLTLVVVHYFFHDGQPQPRTPGLGGDIGFKCPRQNLGREAVAIVADREQSTAWVGMRCNNNTSLLPVSQSVLRVAQQIMYHLTHLVCIC